MGRQRFPGPLVLVLLLANAGESSGDVTVSGTTPGHKRMKKWSWIQHKPRDTTAAAATTYVGPADGPPVRRPR